MGTQYIHVDLIDPDPEQPRKNKPVEYLRDELAKSIASEGMNNPIHIRENLDNPGRWWVVNGECRWTALSMFVKGYWDGTEKDGFKIDSNGIFIECKEKNLNTRREVLKNQIMDNVVRLNMRPLEILGAISEAINKEEIPIEDCAKAFGMTVATIEADLPILQLPEKMKLAWDKGILPKAVARKIATLPSKQYEKAFEHAMSGKTVDTMLKKIQSYLDKVNQIDLFNSAMQNADSKEKKDAKATFGQLVKAMEKFSGSPYLNGNTKLLILVHSQQTEIIERTAREMRKIADTLTDELKQYKVRKKSAVV